MADPRLRILLIDDDRVDRSSIVRHAESHRLPYDVTQAGSLAEASRCLREASFDVVLLDYMLGDGSGLELLKELNTTPAIVLSGAGNEQVAVQAMRQGAYDYLIKDVEGNYLTVLPATIENVVARKRGEDALRASEERYRMIADNVTDIIWSADFVQTPLALGDGAGQDEAAQVRLRLNYASPAVTRILGYSLDEFISKPLVALVSPESYRRAVAVLGEAVRADMQAQRAPDQQWTVDLELVRKDGATRWCEVSATFLRDRQQRPTGVLGVARDVTGRKRAERKLKDYAAALEAANKRLEELHAAAQVATRSKSEFLANMSHEIRTPLTAIMGFAEIVLTEGDISRAPPHRLEAIHAILRNSSYLLSILNDILDLSKIEAGRLDVERVACSPVQVVADVLHLMQVRADAKRLPLMVEFAGPVPETIHSDPTRLRQVLINLIGNAIKFTDAGSVRLAVRFLPGGADGAMMQFDVIDTGIGLEPQQVGRLFQPFNQADSSTTRRFGGTGLGLTISKRLTEMLGGTITIESRPGAGSTFRATVATGPLENVAMLPAPAVDAVCAADVIDDVLTQSGQIQLACRVLLAEDAPDNRRLISFILTKANAEVSCAENGQIACEKALAAWREGRPFDVILMDMQMPVLDGYQATRALRNQGYAGKIVALTADAMAGQRELCLRAGCDDYVTKPIKRQRLLAVVARHLARYVAATAGNDVY